MSIMNDMPVLSTAQALAGRVRINAYVQDVLVVAFLAWCYWEWNNPNFEWWITDGYPTLVAAKLWWFGHGNDVYQMPLWIPDGGSREWMREMARLGIPNGGTAFVYHPLYLMAFAPLIVHFSVSQFSMLLLAVNALSVGVVFAETLRLVEVRIEATEKWVALILVSVSFPSIYAAFLGQNVLPTLALVLLGYRLLSAGGFVLGGGLLAFAVAMKVWTLPIVVVALLLNGKRAVVAGAIAMVALLVITPWLVDSALMSSYMEIAGRLSKASIYPFNNASIRAMLERAMEPTWTEFSSMWVSHDVPRHIRYLELGIQAMVAGLAAGIWLVKRPPKNVSFAVALCFGLIPLGICWTHYFVFAVPLSCLLFWRGGSAFRWAGLFSLLYLVLPWHGLPGVRMGWPMYKMAANPTEWNLLISLPMLVFIVLGLSALTFPKSKWAACMSGRT